MGTTLDNGIYLPDEGERNCYEGLAGNWVALDNHLGSTNIHVTINDKQAWDGHVADTTIHVTSADKQAWDGHVADSVKHVTAEDKAKWDAVTSKADDIAVVHNTGNEYITGAKTFGKGTLIVDNSVGSNVHGEIKLSGSRPGYIVADSSSDGVFDNTNCGISILLQDKGKPLHVGSYKVGSDGRVFVDNTNKNPVLTVRGNFIGSSILIPENDTSNNAFRIISELAYANGNPSKVLNVVFAQYDDANATSAIYSNTDNVTSLGVSNRRWSDVKTYKVNTLEPSSLSLPSDRSARIDISGYFTNTGSLNTNDYSVPANGFIFLNLMGVNGVDCYSLDGSNATNYAQSYLRPVDGQIYILFPVRKNDTFRALWTSNGGTVSVADAFFIPCQGNI